MLGLKLNQVSERAPSRYMMISCHGKAFALLTLCEGNPSVSGGFPSLKDTNAGHWCFLFALILNKLLNKKLSFRRLGTSSLICHATVTETIWNKAGPLSIKSSGTGFSLHIFVDRYLFRQWLGPIISGNFAPCMLTGSALETFTPWWRHQMEKKFRVTGLLCGEFTGDRWIPRTKASDAELWYFLWSLPEQTGVFCDLRPNQQLSNQWRRWWFETLPRSLWRHCNATSMQNMPPCMPDITNIYWHSKPLKQLRLTTFLSNNEACVAALRRKVQ